MQTTIISSNGQVTILKALPDAAGMRMGAAKAADGSSINASAQKPMFDMVACLLSLLVALTCQIGLQPMWDLRKQLLKA